MLPKKRHDEFCWCCNKEAATSKCSKCVRAFHSKCVSVSNHALLIDWSCPVCVKLEAATTIQQNDLVALSIVIDRAIDDEKFKCYSRLTHSIFLANPMTLLKIKEKVGTYRSFEEFLEDAKWIEHNCLISYKENHAKPLKAAILVDYFAKEIEKVKMCAECYCNENSYPDSWLSMACSKLHRLVWVKGRKSNIYWPAKLMSIDEQQRVNVLLFSCKTRIAVPAANCLLYSNTNPNGIFITYAPYTAALEEADLYIKNTRACWLYQFDSDSSEPTSSAGEIESNSEFHSTFSSEPGTDSDLEFNSEILNASEEVAVAVTQAEQHQNPCLKRKSAFENDDVGSGSAVDLRELSLKKIRTDAPCATQSADDIHSEETIEKIEEEEEDCDSDAVTECCPFESNENSCESEMCKEFFNACAAASNMFFYLTRSDRSKTDEITSLKEEIEIARAEIEVLKNENETERNRSRMVRSQMLAERQRASDEIQKMEKKHRDKMNEIENTLLELIRGET